MFTCVALSNGDAGDTDSSQETFELFGSIKKKISGMNKSYRPLV